MTHYSSDHSPGGGGGVGMPPGITGSPSGQEHLYNGTAHTNHSGIMQYSCVYTMHEWCGMIRWEWEMVVYMYTLYIVVPVTVGFQKSGYGTIWIPDEYSRMYMRM